MSTADTDPPMANKRKKHPLPRPSEAQEAVKAAVESLRATRQRDADIILKAGAAGLAVGRQMVRYFQATFALRDFLALLKSSQAFKVAFPAVSGAGEPSSRTPQLDFGPPNFALMLAGIENRVLDLKGIATKLVADVEAPEFKRFARLWSEPEVAMVAWSQVGPMVAGTAKEPILLSTSERMSLAIALGVDAPTEKSKSRKWRWESRSRSQNIRNAVISLRLIGGPNMDLTPDQLEERYGYIRRAIAEIAGQPDWTTPGAV